MLTIRERLSAEALEIANNAKGREFTAAECERLHFLRTLALHMLIADWRRERDEG